MVRKLASSLCALLAGIFGVLAIPGSAFAQTGAPTAQTFDALGGVFAVLALVAVVALVVLGYSLHRRNKDKDR